MSGMRVISGIEIESRRAMSHRDVRNVLSKQLSAAFKFSAHSSATFDSNKYISCYVLKSFSAVSHTKQNSAPTSLSVDSSHIEFLSRLSVCFQRLSRDEVLDENK